MAHLLVVDDQPHVVRVLKRSLERDGHRVAAANNGAQALAAVAEAPPQVIFSDIEMPQMSGTALCEALQTQYGSAMPHVILVSGHFDPQMDQWLRRFDGRVQFFEKPVSLARMREILSDLPGPPA